MQEQWRSMRDQLATELDLSRDVSDEELKEIIRERVSRYAREHMMTLQQRENCQQQIFNSFRKLDVLQELLDDPEVTEIMINGPKHIFYEKHGALHPWNGGVLTEDKLSDMIQQIVGRANRVVNEASPICDARISTEQQGVSSRFNVVLHPVAIDGSAVSIRKFARDPITMEKLIQWGSISREAADLLILLVRAGYNIFVSGGTGSGKTTFLNALSEYIPSDLRVVTIEDSAELQMRNIPNLVRLETRQGNQSGAQPITIRDLIRTALRMRPDRIIVGEVRGSEALDMLQAMNTGHDGSLSTGHGNSAQDMLARLETMVLMGNVDLPVEAIRRQINSGIDIIVHLSRMRDKSRKVLQIAELCGIEDGVIQLNTLYQFEENNGKEEKVVGAWKQKGSLIYRFKLQTEGLEEVYRNTVGEQAGSE